MIAIVPLRAGSKSIPRKNVKPMAGRPLAQWVIEAALKASAVETTVIATDDPDVFGLYRLLSQAWGSHQLVLHHRSDSTATDTATTESVMLEVAAAHSQEGDTLCLLQATSPLTSPRDIDLAYDTFRSGAWDSLLSVVPQRRFIWADTPTGATPLNYDPGSRPRRQDTEPILVENGAIYITTHDALIKTGCRLSGRIATYQMSSASFAEVDEPEDWAPIEAILRHRGNPMPEGAADIQLLLTDVDGVLTDSGMYWSSDGSELKKFSARDGKAFELLREAGIATGILSSESIELIRRRAEKLQAHVSIGCDDKRAEADRLRRRLGLRWDQVAYVGDDLHDADLLSAVGLSVAPADASPAILSQVMLVTQASGGHGCFREVSDLILRAKSVAEE